MSQVRARALSGIQPTGVGFHLGNYLGAVRNWGTLMSDYEAFYFVADLHAITAGHDPAVLRQRTRESAAELLAAGLDPQRCTLFIQSHVPEHTELGWILGCITGFGEASRMTQFKDKSARLGTDSVTVGLFAYPILQAADILLYQADVVPVGADQRQHLELTRDLAGRFNTRFGQAFTIPEPYILAATAKILDLQDPARQMSKSVGGPGVLWLQDDPTVLRKKIKSAVTDTGRDVTYDPVDKPGISNLITIFAELSGRSRDDVTAEFGDAGYGTFKGALAEVVVESLAPVRARYQELLADPAELDRVLASGAQRAREVATATIGAVREAIGFLPPSL